MPVHVAGRPLAALSVLALAVAGSALPEVAHAVDLTSPVVISEVYGGGGNSSAPYQNDFIELSNSSAVPQSVDGWSVQYASAGGTAYQVTPLSGSVPAGGFYLVQEAAGSGTAAPLPTPSATGTINLSAASGKVALVNATTALTGCTIPCSAAPGVVDFVGYGTANDSATAAAPGLSNTTSDQRSAAEANTGSNAADFTAAAPTPGVAPASAPPPTCSSTPLPEQCVPGTTTIQDVQGDGFLSPLKGDSVDKVPGIVTAVRSTGKSQGFWMQDPSPTPDPAASSGVFVFTSSANVKVGDSVLVSGKVADFYTLASGETLATTSSLSDTELDPTTITTLSAGNKLPAPVVLTPANVPTLYAPSPVGGNVESIATVDPTHSVLEFFEAHEGMLVEVDNARVIGPADTFGELYVTDKPDEQVTPRGGSYIAGYDSPPTGRLLVQPLSGLVPPANTGDELVGATVGPVDWSGFGGYDLAATTVGTYQDNHLTATTATPQAADQLAVATYNVENLAPSDADSKFARLAAGVVDNLKSPDIISVEEIQDNTGATDGDGVVAADQTITKLVNAITAAGGPSYSSSEIDPVDDADGGQPGGNIRVVFLYNPLRVTFVAKPGGDATTAVTVSTGTDGTPELSISPGRVDPTNAAWTSSRKPLAGEFVFQGNKVIVVGNHFDAKLGDQNADGRFQPPTRSSEIQRNEQATVLGGFVKQVLAADPRANVVLAGDFNDYQFSQTIQTLTDNGATLTDEINTLPVNERYTYVFDGVSQVLDHIFVSKPLTDAGAVEYDVIHDNAEFSGQVSDHDPQVVRIRPVPHQVPSTLTLTSSAPTSVLGSAVHFTATPSSGGGTVSFTVDGIALGSPVPLVGGLAVSPSTTSLSPGAHTVTATYSGDVNTVGSTASITEYVQYAVRVLLPVSSARAGDPLVLAFQLTDVSGHAITDAQAKALGCRVTAAGSGPQSLPSRCSTYVGGVRLFGTIWLTSNGKKGAEVVTITVTYPDAPAQQLTVPVSLR